MFVGIAGSAAASGIAIIMFEWHVSLKILMTNKAELEFFIAFEESSYY